MFLEDLGLSEPGSAKLIRGAYKLLDLETYFTAGVKEVRAWTIPVGATAPQAAGVIHTDFEKGFIRAEVISYDDYVKYGSEAKVKEAGRMRVEGKEYIVKDGDVMHFRFKRGFGSSVVLLQGRHGKIGLSLRCGYARFTVVPHAFFTPFLYFDIILDSKKDLED
mgnify:CR=1 FL=1